MNNIIDNKQFFNKEIRAKLKADPKAYIKSFNSSQLEGIDYKVVESSKDVFYVVMPYVDGSMSTQDMQNMLGAAQASSAGSFGSLGSVGTVGTMSSIAGSVGTISSTSTVGTVTTAGSVKP